MQSFGTSDATCDIVCRFEAQRELVAKIQEERWKGESTFTSKEYQVSDRAKDPFSGMVFN